MELLISMLWDLLITAVSYLLVPIIIIICGKRLTLPQIKRVVIINGACVWLESTIVLIQLGADTVSYAVLLWSYIAYLIMKKKCAKNDDITENKAHEPIRKKEKPYKIDLIAVSLVLALSLGLNLYQVSVIHDINSATVQNYKTSDLDVEKLNFFDSHIVFVEDDNTTLYHKYECNRFKGDCYWAYNIEQAEYLGYTPCPICRRG